MTLNGLVTFFENRTHNIVVWALEGSYEHILNNVVKSAYNAIVYFSFFHVIVPTFQWILTTHVTYRYNITLGCVDRPTFSAVSGC